MSPSSFDSHDFLFEMHAYVRISPLVDMLTGWRSSPTTRRRHLFSTKAVLEYVGQTIFVASDKTLYYRVLAEKHLPRSVAAQRLLIWRRPLDIVVCQNVREVVTGIRG
jgi:hypothetical protein